MIGATLLASMRAKFSRWLKLVPTLFKHDLLFRYATIAAVLALIFLAVSFGQDIAGRRDGPTTGAAPATAPDNFQQGNASSAEGSRISEPPAPGSSSEPAHDETPAVAPGRPLQGIKVAPAPRDSFGTVPKEGSSP
ncbi:hypothetical protein [Mesorhizobium sp. WSM3224]|uniref:hypothetical protein n=1 Tax=Mesorhizobium sp. WSM3224 TaxID=1040986 RepID=UPI0003F838E0|nr:hypothetical protein [Mesorhizobium sp. WSM3224]